MTIETAKQEDHEKRPKRFRGLRRLWRDERGVAPLEYALVAVMIAMVIIHAVSLLGSNVSKVFSTVANTI